MPTAGGILSQDSFISAAPSVHDSRLPADPGWWQTEVVSHHQRADKKHHFPLHCCSLLQLSAAGPDCADTFPEAAVRSALQRLFNHFVFAPDVAHCCCGMKWVKAQWFGRWKFDVVLHRQRPSTFSGRGRRHVKVNFERDSCAVRAAVGSQRWKRRTSPSQKTNKEKACVCVLFVLSEEKGLRGNNSCKRLTDATKGGHRNTGDNNPTLTEGKQWSVSFWKHRCRWKRGTELCRDMRKASPWWRWRQSGCGAVCAGCSLCRWSRRQPAGAELPESQWRSFQCSRSPPTSYSTSSCQQILLRPLLLRTNRNSTSVLLTVAQHLFYSQKYDCTDRWVSVQPTYLFPPQTSQTRKSWWSSSSLAGSSLPGRPPQPVSAATAPLAICRGLARTPNIIFLLLMWC